MPSVPTASPPRDGRSTNVVLGLILVLTMVTGVFQLVASAIVASTLTDDLVITTVVFGLVTTVNTAVGAAFAPRSGRISDQIGAKRSVLAVMFIGAIGLLVMAWSPNVWWLLGSSAFSGLGQGWCNPATNKLIADRVPPGQRGTLTGIKQSGVQLAGLLAGATLPTLTALYGWRAAISVYAVGAAVAGAVSLLVLPADREAPGDESAGDPRAAGSTSTRPRLPRAIVLLTAYAFTMGCVVGGTGRFLPLFAEEQLGMSNFSAGMVSALLGGLAIGTRIVWARAAETRIRPGRALAVQAGLTMVALTLLLLATAVGSGLLWLVAVVGSVGMNSWNSVAMLAVISGVPLALAGRASGVVVMGFMVGLSLGGVFPGLVETWTGTYTAAWAVLLVLAGVAASLATFSKDLGNLGAQD